MRANPTKEIKFSSFAKRVNMEEKQAPIWHAFNALDDHNKGTGMKSQLKVLTHNLATCLGIQDAEKGLEDFRSTTELSFRDYLYYLKVELFALLNETDKENANVDVNKIDETCWYVCSKKYLVRPMKLLSGDSVFKLWRVFNTYTESDLNGELLYPVVVESEEIGIILHKLLLSCGKVLEPGYVENILTKDKQYRFEEALIIFETACSGIDGGVIKDAINEIYDEHVSNIIKQGPMTKKGPKMNLANLNWKDRWFVLTPEKLLYYTHKDLKDLKGEISIKTNVKVETVPDKQGSRSNRLLVTCEGRTYEISAPDLRTRNEWVTAIKTTIELSGKNKTPNKIALLKRRDNRASKRADLDERIRKEEEEKIQENARQEEETRKKEEEQKKREEEEKLKLEEEKRVREEEMKKEEEAKKKMEEEIEKTRQELESERLERATLEERLKAEAAAREAEAERTKQLQEYQAELEKLLEQEKQAKKDEEIVRNLQAKILEEEFEKAAALEKLKEEQEKELQEERQCREKLEHNLEGLKQQHEDLESVQQEKERELLALREKQELLLQEEKAKLEQVEADKKANEAKLQEALEKLLEAEAAKCELQIKMKEKENQKVIGLARPIQPSVRVLESHRGPGAFPKGDKITITSMDSENEAPPELSNSPPTNGDSLNGNSFDEADDIVEV